MANQEHLQILEQGVAAWNRWRHENRRIRPDLSGANLVRIDLREADLGRVLNAGVDLTGAYLSQVVLYETILGNTNLTATQGLETCHHHGPSTLDPRTLARSGLLPLAFLRGCGLNDWEIEATKLYQPGLTPTQISDIVYRIYDLRADPLIQFFSCFISYNHTDAVFARSLHDRLQDRDFLPFVNPNLSNCFPHLHDRLTMNPARIIARPMTQHGHEDTQQSIANTA